MFQHIYKVLDNETSLYYAWFQAMHTRVDIALTSVECEANLTQVVESIQHKLFMLEHLSNFFDEKSELSKVNQQAAYHPVKVTEELFHIFEKCMEYNEQTLGCFDVCIQSAGYNKSLCQSIQLNPSKHTVSFPVEGMKVDLSGFIKGYAIDRIAELLNESGIQNGLVNLGNSSILSMGNHPCGEGWKLSNGYVLKNQCMTVSGNDVPSRKHIFSPSVGQWVEGVGTVMLVTESGTLGEVLSTAFFAASSEQRTRLKARFAKELIYYVENPS